MECLQVFYLLRGGREHNCLGIDFDILGIGHRGDAPDPNFFDSLSLLPYTNE